MPSPTRAAVLTPQGQGGIAVLHVAGPRALDLLADAFRPHRGSPAKADARRVHYGHIVDQGRVVDEVLVRVVPGLHGEQPRVEVNCHGGLVAVQRVLECFVRRGAQAVAAEALLEADVPSAIAAEARRALLEAATPLGVEILLHQLDGALDRALRDVPWTRLSEAASALRHLLSTARLGRSLWRPRRVALVGPANAGKSTLFNALAREDRVIVSPTPGTTRDSIAAEVALGGIPVWLTDTAGERAPGSAIEAEAIARSRATAAEADLVLLVLDGSEPLPMSLGDLLASTPRPFLLVRNKADLPPAPWTEGPGSTMAVSAVSATGLDRLTEAIAGALVGGAAHEPAAPVVFTGRQAEAIRQALSALEAGDVAGARREIDGLT